jgi:hypothetical protein
LVSIGVVPRSTKKVTVLTSRLSVTTALSVSDSPSVTREPGAGVRREILGGSSSSSG